MRWRAAALSPGSTVAARPAARTSVAPNACRAQRYFARFEFADDPHLLCCSDASSLSMRELLELADDDAKARWEALTLGYTESAGTPALREEIARCCLASGERHTGKAALTRRSAQVPRRGCRRAARAVLRASRGRSVGARAADAGAARGCHRAGLSVPVQLGQGDGVRSCVAGVHAVLSCRLAAQLRGHALVADALRERDAEL